MNAHAPLAQELLLIADLSGYTGYLAGAEPEEAPLIAGDLVETVVSSLVPPFQLAGLEGDAAFFHADRSRVDGPELIAALAGSYDAFRRRVESLRLGSTCECAACRTVPGLDLKFFAHVGTVLHQRIAGRDELSGRDVILVHRLMKDSAPAQAGATSYALITDAAVDALDIDAAAAGLQPVRQEYEHIGAVDGFLLDGDALREAAPAAAATSDAVPIAEARRTIAAEAPVVWGFLTTPTGRQAWEGIELVEDLSPDAPRGVGSRSRCVARHLTAIEEILEWDAPRRIARRTELPGIGPAIVRYALEPADGGTRLIARWDAVATPPPTSDATGLETALDRLAAVAVSR